jgi:hypothetical protein
MYDRMGLFIKQMGVGVLSLTMTCQLWAGTVVFNDTLTTGQATTRAPAPITPVGNTITSFTGYTGPFPYILRPFYVTQGGDYTLTLGSSAVSNGFYILRGTFSPSNVGTPTTPLSQFVVFRQNLSSTQITPVTLNAGEQYSILEIFNSGNSSVTMTITGPGDAIAGAPSQFRAVPLDGPALPTLVTLAFGVFAWKRSRRVAPNSARRFPHKM